MKKLFNRKAVVTTSKGLTTATSETPILQAFSGGKFGGPVGIVLPYYLKAKSQSRGGNPQESLWDIKMHADIYERTLATSISFDAMARTMKACELKIAREGGAYGTDAEIIAQRKAAVKKKNILNLNV